MAKRSRKEEILATMDDMVTKFLYYDRKEDSDLPVGSIEDAVIKGEITFDEMVSYFKTTLYEDIRKK